MVIPARNEQDSIAATINSIQQQSLPVNEIIVVANNCSDGDKTAEISQQMGATTFQMFHNKHLKAGALNYVLEQIIPKMNDQDCILIMDADTQLSTDLIERCVDKLDQNPNAGAVGSIFVGRETKTLLGWMQKMEFWRYKRQIHRNGDKAFVLSGTASVFLVKTFKAVRDARNNGKLPFGGGSFYDIVGLTEDNEITLAIATIGFDCLTAEVTAATDVMENITTLKKQRERWYGGALVNLKSYGRSLPWHLKWVYWSQQIGLFFSLLTLMLLYSVWVFLLVNYSKIDVNWWWLLPLGILAVERTFTVWQLGWKARLIAATIIPEQIYSILLIFFYSLGLADFIIGKKGQWHQT